MSKPRWLEDQHEKQARIQRFCNSIDTPRGGFYVEDVEWLLKRIHCLESNLAGVNRKNRELQARVDELHECVDYSSCENYLADGDVDFSDTSKNMSVWFAYDDKEGWSCLAAEEGELEASHYFLVCAPGEETSFRAGLDIWMDQEELYNEG